jgi:hypothetical protein
MALDKLDRKARLANTTSADNNELVFSQELQMGVTPRCQQGKQTVARRQKTRSQLARGSSAMVRRPKSVRLAAERENSPLKPLCLLCRKL